METGSEAGVSVEPAPAVGAEAARLRVFLSYSRKDGEFVARLAEALTGPKFEAAYDASPHAKNNPELGIAAEDEWWKQLERMIAAADAMVFIVSPDSIASKVCDEEIVYARTMGKRVIAVMRREIDFAKAPPRLAALNVKLRFLDDGEAGFAASLAALSDALELDAAWWREQTWLAEQVKTWRDAEEDKRSDWLLSAAELERAERWAARRPVKAPPMSEAELDFLAASRARQAELAEGEARKLKVRRRLQLGVLVLTVVALAISIGGGIFVVDRQRSVARSESLMLANAARGQADAGADASALRLSLLAARDTFLSPASAEAEALLARTSAAWRLEKEFLAKPGTTDHAAISEDGTRIVSWDQQGTDLTLWDANDGRVIETLTLPVEDMVTSVITEVWFSGAVVVASVEDITFQSEGLTGAWQASDGKPLWHRFARVGPVRAQASRTGQRLAVTESRDGEDGKQAGNFVVVIDVMSGDPVFEQQVASLEQPAAPEAMKISDDGKSLALWSAGEIRVVTVADKTVARRIKPQFAKPPPTPLDPLLYPLQPELKPSGLTFSRDGKLLAAWTRDYAVQGWNLETGAVLDFLEKTPYRFSLDADDRALFEEKPDGVAFAPGGDSAVMWSTRGVARWVSPQMYGGVQIRAAPGTETYIPITPLPNGLGIMTRATLDSALRIWWFADPEKPRQQMQHQAPLLDAVLSTDGRRAVARDESKTVVVWDVDNGRRLARFRQDDGIAGFALTADGRVLTWGDGGVMRLWRADDGVTVQLEDGAAGLERDEAFDNGSVMFSRDGSRAMIWDRTLLALTDAKTGKVDFHNLTDSHWCGLSLDPEMRCGAAAIGDRRFVLWNGDRVVLTTDVGQLGLQVLWYGRRHGVVSVSADGGKVLGYGEDGVRVWDVANNKELFSALRGEEPRDATFIGDGSRFAAWGESLTIRLFDGATGKKVGETAPLAAVLAENAHQKLIVSPDGRWAVSDAAGDDAWSLVAMEDKAQPSPLKMPPGHNDVVFSGAPNVFVTWGIHDLAVWTITPEGKAEHGELINTESAVQAVRFSPDGRQFATLEKNLVRLWRIGERESYATVIMDRPDGMQFSVDGSRFIAWGPELAEMLDTATGELVLQTPQVTVATLAGLGMAALSRDGQRLAFMTPQVGVRLYDVGATVRPSSVSELRQAVCGTRASGDRPTAGAAMDYWHVTDADADAAPVLRRRVGENVCLWERQWYDVALDTLFGWMK